MESNGNPPGSVDQLAGLIQGAIDQFADEFPDTPAETIREALGRVMEVYRD